MRILPLGPHVLLPPVWETSYLFIKSPIKPPSSGKGPQLRIKLKNKHIKQRHALAALYSPKPLYLTKRPAALPQLA